MPAALPPRRATPRRYAMCRPDHFAVRYAINPWMHPGDPVDRDLAVAQWEALRQTYLDLGHVVEVVPGLPEQPDMVFAANGGVVLGGRALGARFAHVERAAEGPAFAAWLRARGVPVHEPEHVGEGEGDFLVVGDRLLAGTGFRTAPAAHEEAARVLDAEVVPLRLVDPRYYHLDTALAVLADDDVAYVRGAFDPDALATLERLYPHALVVGEQDAGVLGLNAVSDGLHVVLPAAATRMAADLAARGYVPVPVDLSELLKGGGSVKCCTLELRG
ncbi:dimethylargininase [Pseudokineococcus basanitobsidens]|uniref:dimethylargininase n=1 Tax=Pseudokineococcus basanitobsidens TaxID=1926649 RepID=UPI003BB4AFBC